MVHNVGNCWYTIVMVVIYSSYTYGPLWKGPLVIPQNDHRTCAGWMYYHGFVDNLDQNTAMAHDRSKEFDHQAYVYAATFAYFVSTFLPKHLKRQKHIPSEYCQRFENSDFAIPHMALKDAKMTCKKWILAYGYHEKNAKLNHEMAFNRNLYHDGETHIWVLMYTRYIKELYTPKIDPSEFCLRIGKTESEESELPFVNIGTRKHCEEWLKFSDYGDDVDDNSLKALSQDLNLIDVFLSKWTLDYINYLRKFDRENNKASCCGKFGYPKPDNPAAYCTSVGAQGLVPYYG